jgi:hypothetical protein
VAARNTVLAGNLAASGADLSGDFGSLGHNLIGNAKGGSGYGPSDLLFLDPLLGPLQDNGGPTWTMALLPGSPARAAGDTTDAPSFDQRGPGFARVVQGAIDIGAFEVQASAVTPGQRAGSLAADPMPAEEAALFSLPAPHPEPWTWSAGGDLHVARAPVVPAVPLAAVDAWFAITGESADSGVRRTRIATSALEADTLADEPSLEHWPWHALAKGWPLLI